MKIDKDVPLPNERSRYRFGDMAVGDSVFFENQDSQGNAAKAASQYAGRNRGKKFSARSVDGGVRIWRTA